ncbi:DUF4249 domain-containing protein [Delftia acidovorans]|uniref:Uncharacterized protein n=1 Tax=Delftia acidovorans TaxID=80866 RepID=A0AAJ2R901_DELAC|nr:hypothetical protein [Delftia acidovorans]MDX4957939.1 hypothetical protein [Delftia acidovorans]
MDQVIAGSGADVIVNENFRATAAASVFGMRGSTTAGLTLGYYGGAFGGAIVADGSIALPSNSTVYVVANRTSGVVSAATSTTNWDNQDDYLRIGVANTGPVTIGSWVDWREAYSGAGGSGGGFANPMTAVGDIIVGGTDGDPMRLSAGATGDVLQIVAGQPAWGPGGGGGGGSSLEAPFVAPPQTGWSWVNQGSSTLVDSVSEQVLISAATGSGANLVARARSAPAAPYTLTARLRSLRPTKPFVSTGIGLRNSATGQLVVFDILSPTTGTKIRVTKFNTSVSFSADYTTLEFPSIVDIWMRIADNGTNRVFSYSSDGVYWTQFFSVGRTDFTTPDQLIFMAGTENSATPNFAPIVRLISWKID